jgi:hypothetical protein
MEKKSIFSDELLSSEQLSLESIAGKLYYFEAQLQLIHWQTGSYAEHKATGDLYEYISEFRDGVIEKLMGYMKKKPGVFKIPPIKLTDTMVVAEELCSWTYKLYEWAGEHDYCDIENLAQEANGEANKLKYLLTLS